MCTSPAIKSRLGTPASWPAAWAQRESSHGPIKRPRGPGWAWSQLGKPQRAEAQGHFAHLMLLDVFLFLFLFFNSLQTETVKKLCPINLKAVEEVVCPSSCSRRLQKRARGSGGSQQGSGKRPLLQRAAASGPQPAGAHCLRPSKGAPREKRSPPHLTSRRLAGTGMQAGARELSGTVPFSKRDN